MLARVPRYFTDLLSQVVNFGPNIPCILLYKNTFNLKKTSQLHFGVKRWTSSWYINSNNDYNHYEKAYFEETLPKISFLQVNISYRISSNYSFLFALINIYFALISS